MFRNDVEATSSLAPELTAAVGGRPTAARIPRCSVFCRSRKHLDEVSLLLDKHAEVALLESLPPLKLLMMLQVWMSGRRCLLSTVQRAFYSMQTVSDVPFSRICFSVCATVHMLM